MGSIGNRARTTGRAKAGSLEAGMSVLSVAIEDYKSGLEKFAAMFSGNYGVKLVFRGTSAMTNGKTIIVPELTLLERKNMTDKEVKEALDYLTCTRGFVYHEGAHIVLSDFHAVARRIHKIGGKKYEQLVNILEDARIENKISQTYPGAKEVLAFTRDFVYDQVKLLIEDHAAKGSPLSPYTHLMYAFGAYNHVAKTGRDHPMWKALDLAARRKARQFRELLIEAKNAGSTDAMLDVAEEIWRKLHEKEEKEEPPPPGGTPPPDDDQDENEEDKEESESDDEGGGKKKKQKSKKKKDKKKDKKEKNEKEENDDDESQEDDQDDASSEGGEDDEDSGSGDDDQDDDHSSSGKDDSEDEEDGDEDDDGGAGGGADESDDESDDEGDQEDDDGAGDSSGDVDEDSDDDSSEDSSGAGDDPSDSDDDEEDAEKHPDRDKKDAKPGGDGDKNPDPFNLKDDNTKDDLRETKDTLTEKVQQEAKKQPAGKYRVYTTERDHIGPPKTKVPNGREFVKTLDEETRSIYGPLRRNLENILKARTKSYYVRGLDEGELDNGSLHVLAQTRHSKSPHIKAQARPVFQQKVQTMTLEDTVVGLTVDSSGSMAGGGYGTVDRKDRLAMKCADILGCSLDGVGVPFEVTTWSTEDSRSWMECNSVDRHLYTRFSSLQFTICKGFDEDWRAHRENLYHMTAKRTNIDGESIWVAASRLLSRPERRKVLFVMSDGMPSGESYDNHTAVVAHLSETVARIRAAGVELYAIGIGAPEVERFYKPHFVNVTSANQLPAVMVDHLKTVLHLK